MGRTIAVWDGEAWSEIVDPLAESGANPRYTAIAATTDGFYVSGSKGTTSSGEPAGFIRFYDGATWTDIAPVAVAAMVATREGLYVAPMQGTAVERLHE